MINTACTQCHAKYRLAPEHLGKQVRCKNCGATFVAHEYSDNVILEEIGGSQPPPVPSASSEDVIDAAIVNRGSGTGIASQKMANAAPRVYVAPPGKRGRSDEIDYAIHGDDCQYAEVSLDPGETVIAEAGSMMYMSRGIEMQTVFGDPSASGGGFWSMVKSAGKRVLTGESLFMTTFTNTGSAEKAVVAFAAPYMGHILPMHLDQMGGELICQKDAFLCGAKGVEVSIAFQKKIGVGLFGGEGFIMQRLRGDGIALIHAGGALMHRVLAPGEQLRLDTGCIMALSPSVQYDVQFVGGFKNTIFGGEGLFLATLTGPGAVWLQSLPFSRLAGRIYAAAPQGGGKNVGEGSVLNHLGGLGNLFMGDGS